jgi:hypothetical protein
MPRLPGVCVLLLCLALAACGGNGSSRVDGIVIAVDAPGLTQLNSFTLHTDDNRTLVFRPAPECTRDVTHGCNGGHLNSHKLAASRVRVTYRQDGDTLLAESIEDLD